MVPGQIPPPQPLHYLCPMEILPGRINRLPIARAVDFGVYLDAGEYGEILMPARYVPENAKPGDEIDAFLYCDSEDRMVATTEKPAAQAGEIAWLTCKAVSRFGAFMDWGLMKDLLVPFREQTVPMQEGKSYAVLVYVDEKSGRIAGTAHIEKHLNRGRPLYHPGTEVDLLIYGKSDLGYKALVDNRFSGLLYFSEAYKPLQPGERMKGYVDRVREDGKIDLRSRPAGYAPVQDTATEIMEKLKAAGGFLPFTDDSDPDEIRAVFGMSKKLWKKAAGALYRQRRILMDADGIRLPAED